MNDRQEQKRKERNMKIEESLNYVMNDDRGRFFIAEILSELTQNGEAIYTGNNDTFRNLGQQQVYNNLRKRVISVLGINGFNAWQNMDKEKFERMEEL